MLVWNWAKGLLIRYLKFSPVALMSAFSLCSEAKKELPLPCWLQSPMMVSSQGQIGASRSIALGKLNGEQLSQFRALASLCISQGQLCDDDQLHEALESKLLFGQPVFFASHQIKGDIFGYAGFSKPNTGACEPISCNLNKCEPAWLCQPHEKGKVRLLGVSYRMPDENQQLLSAIDNALDQSEYLYGVDIAAQKKLTNAMFSTGETMMLSEKDQVNFGEENTTPYRLLQQCKVRGTLFTHVEIDHPSQPSDNKIVSPDQWMKTPKLNGIDGAVGVVERMVASGLLSDQIELAVRRGAVQLAFERGSHVKEDRVQLNKGSDGIMFVSYVSEQTEVEIKIKVMQIHFKQNKSDALKVYAWVAAI